MTTGFDITKDVVDNQAGVLVVQLRDTFRDVERLKLWLDENDDAALTALGYTPAKITLLRGSIGDLAKLGRIAVGADTQPAPSDFFFNARRLTGLR
jgi:hypothetical protein